MGNHEYDASSIQILTGLEPVRRRPGMWIGDVDAAGLNHLLTAVVADAADGHELGDVDRIRVGIDGATIAIEDNGPGIPVELLEVLPTRLHGGGLRWRRERHRLFGLGWPVVNALSERFEVESWRAGRAHTVRFTRGVQDGPIADLGPTTRHGTRVTFTPDFTILKPNAWDRGFITTYLCELAAFNPALTVILDRVVCRAPDGLSDLVRHLAGDPWSVPIRLSEEHGDAVSVDAALLWTDRPRSEVHGYVNQTAMGGVHVESLRWAVVGAMRQLDDRLVRVHAPALFEVVSEGLVAAVHVELADPKLSGQCRHLDNPEVATAVLDTITSGMADELATDHELRDRLLARIPR